MRGFTLIEVVVYIALLGVLLVGAVSTAYLLVQNSSRLSDKNTTGEEGSFVMRKLDWALSGAQSISAPTSLGSTLSLVRYDGTTIDVRLSSGVVQMRENGASYLRITTPNVSIGSLSFHYLPPSGSTPAGIEASVMVDGLVFTTLRYLRK